MSHNTFLLLVVKAVFASCITTGVCTNRSESTATPPPAADNDDDGDDGNK